jgi:hypothetical protein
MSPVLGSDARIVRAVEDIDTATSGKWARTDRPVRPSAGVDGGHEAVEVGLAGDVGGAGHDLVGAMEAAAVLLSSSIELSSVVVGSVPVAPVALLRCCWRAPSHSS